jgi:N-methylhydantoinase A
VEAHYARQTHFIRFPLLFSTLSREEVLRTFELEYRKKRGELVKGVPVHIMYVRAIATGIRRSVDLKMFVGTGHSSLERAKKASGTIYHEGQRRHCPVYERTRLPIGPDIQGPAIITESTATAFIGYGSYAKLDPLGNIVVRRGK